MKMLKPKHAPSSLKLVVRTESGFIMPTILSFIIAAIIISAAVVEVIGTNFSTVNNNVQRQQAFNIAEAGINYYLWHLSHNATDYKDGQTTPAAPDPKLGWGPYVHNYIDDNSVNEGTFTLWINPQGNGSTVATVRSIGQVKGTNIIRTVQAQLGQPSFASYGLIGDSALWFGPDETADGPVHSNAGIEMDGPNTDQVTSANSTYIPPRGLHSLNYADGVSHPGVWCDPSVTAPVNCNTRSKSNWNYPVPTVDFNQVSNSLCAMKKTAFADFSQTSALATQANACTQTPATLTNAYIPQQSGSFSTTKGYFIRLNNNGTYDLFKVSSENDRPSTWSYASALGITNTTCTKPLWTACGVSFPPSGVIFVEDNVWVSGQVGPAFQGRLTIAAGRLASASNASIVIAGPLVYLKKDGTESLGLVAEGDVMVAPYAVPASGAFNFEIDGALLAESGNVMYGESISNRGTGSVYRSTPGNCTLGWVNANQTLTFYGSVSTRQIWTWNWGGPNCPDAVKDTSNNTYFSGIEHTITQYDYNMEYAPPPSYPLTSGFNVLSWREILTSP